MEKQVYNFEALTKIRKKREKSRRIKMIMAAVCIVAVLIVLYILSSSRCEYYVYKDKTDTEDNVDVSYETFAEACSHCPRICFGVEPQPDCLSRRRLWAGSCGRG